MVQSTNMEGKKKKLKQKKMLKVLQTIEGIKQKANNIGPGPPYKWEVKL